MPRPPGTGGDEPTMTPRWRDPTSHEDSRAIVCLRLDVVREDPWEILEEPSESVGDRRPDGRMVGAQRCSHQLPHAGRELLHQAFPGMGTAGLRSQGQPDEGLRSVTHGAPPSAVGRD
jgi:hypothetical protein